MRAIPGITVLLVVVAALAGAAAALAATPSLGRVASTNEHDTFDTGSTREISNVTESRMGVSDGPAPNVVFLICESIDGRTFRDGSPVPLPNVQRLANKGVLFENHYAASPVCCPSRASIWSGRHTHHIGHEHNGIQVNGAWNNYEGMAPTYNNKIGDVLNRSGVNVKIAGKTDWTSGAHAPWNWLQFWTMYTPFPYNASEGGLNEQPEAVADSGAVCDAAGDVQPGHYSHEGDWTVVNSTTQWIKDVAGPAAKGGTPFFAYQGMNIVHPPYQTSQYWFDKIDADDVIAPAWLPLDQLHPCNFQSIMLKGCIPDERNATAVANMYSIARRKRIRRKYAAVYYAMIAEFDAMVGRYIDAVEQAGVMDNTYFIVTADHGDMDMEHQSFYKMDPRDASSLVPLVISGPGVQPVGWQQSSRSVAVPGAPPAGGGVKAMRVVSAPTSHVDLFPTIMDMSSIKPASWPQGLDGASLVPVLRGGSDPTRSVLSQGHMADNAISWYMLRRSDLKLIVYGNGTQNAPQLFNLTTDPGEMKNLAAAEPAAVASMQAELTAMVNISSVTQDVAEYNLDMFKWWTGSHGKDWHSVMTGMLPWSALYAANPAGFDAALNSWMSTPPAPTPCRSDWVYPPQSDSRRASSLEAWRAG